MPGLLHVTKRPNGSTRGYFSYAVRSVDYLETVRRRLVRLQPSRQPGPGPDLSSQLHRTSHPPSLYRRKNFPAPLRDNKAGTQEGKAPKGANAQEDPRGKTRGASLTRTGQEQDPRAQEYRRRYAEEQRQRAKLLGKYHNCSKQAIPSQSRCPTCAEAHRQSPGHSYAERRRTGEQTRTPT